MSDIWVWTLTEVEPLGDGVARDASSAPGNRNLTGYAVEATDGHIGNVGPMNDDDMARGCVIVDTGFWIFGKKRMVPAGALLHWRMVAPPVRVAG